MRVPVVAFISGIRPSVPNGSWQNIEKGKQEKPRVDKKRKATLFWAAHSNQPSKNIMFAKTKPEPCMLLTFVCVSSLSVYCSSAINNSSKVA